MEHERDHETPQAITAQALTIEGTVSRPEGIQVAIADPGESIGPASRPEGVQAVAPDPGGSIGPASTARPETSPTDLHLLRTFFEDSPASPRAQENLYTDFELSPPPPPRSRSGHGRTPSNRHGPVGQSHSRQDEKGRAPRNVGERLKPTIRYAVAERKKYAQRAMWAGWAVNIAIGLQVFLGALTTVLASAITNARRAQITTSVLGGLATMVASYLARARGSGEPELSNTRARDLEHFLRDCMAFQIDHYYEHATAENGLDSRLEQFRQKFENLLSNAEGERKLSLAKTNPSPSNPA